MNEPPLLSVSNLSIKFVADGREETAVESVSFEVDRGEILGVVGESGSGKSVTCYSLLGLLPPAARVSSGEAFLDGIDLLKMGENGLRKIRGKRISMIFQDPMTSLNPYMTVGDQIVEPLLLHESISKTEARSRAIGLLHELGIEEASRRFNDYPDAFSGGMRQRVMIAMALITEPDLLIADEPTSALDVTVQAVILALIKQAQALRDLAVVFVSHDLDVVRQVADRVVVMEKGKVVEQGACWQVLDRASHPYTRRLLDAIPSSAKPEEYRSDRTGAPDFLDVKNMQVDFDDFTAVDNVSFTVQQGEVFGIVGESGSGKTTLSRTIFRLVQPTSGQVLLSGMPLLSLSGHALKKHRKDIQMVFQDPYASLNPRMTVHDIIAEPIVLHELSFTQENVSKRVLRLMRDVGLSPRWANKYPHEFSGGQRQRVAIARAIAAEPRLIVADEPVSALDVTVQARVLELLLKLVKERQLTMIFISHDLAVVRFMSDRVGVMKSGRLIEVGDTEKVYSEPREQYTRDLVEIRSGAGLLDQVID